MLRRIPVRLALLLLMSSSAWAASPSLIGLPQSADPTCNAGEYYLAVLTTGSKWRKCENGVWSDIGSVAGAGEANTASNLGGGLANYDSKTGVDLRFNSFNSSHFDLSSNLISADESGLEALLDLPDLAGILPLAKFTDDATAGLCLTSGGGGSDPSWTTCPGGGGGGGAPTSTDYLVGTADAGLSAEIVVGTTPGGELGGTWASPTIDSNVIEELNQTGTEDDLRYDSTAHCYYIDADGDSTRDSAPATGEREGCVGLGDDIYPEEFATGSSTLGFQEAINHICESGKPERGAVLRLRGGVYNMGTATLSVPVNCNGFTMQGVSPDTYNGTIGAGTEIKTTHTGAGFDFMTFAGTLRDVELSNFRVTVVNPGVSTRIFVVGSLTSKFNMHDVMVSTTGAVADPDGIGLHITDPIKCRIELNEFELLGAGIVHTGTTGSGGCTYRANRFETQGNSTGVGLLIGEANYACTNVFVEGNIFEGNNIGLKIDTTASGAKSCKVTAIGNHFENATIGSDYEDVRLTGANSYISIGNYYAGGLKGGDAEGKREDAWHRTTDTDPNTTDVSIGDQLYGPITMDAGSCMIQGAADSWRSGAGVDYPGTACSRMSVDSTGFYVDLNSDGDFDSTDARFADADLIDLQDGSLTYSKIGGGTASKCARFDGSGNLVAASGDCASGDTGGGGGSSLPVADTTSIVEGSGDASKEVRIEVDGLTTATTRVLTMPDFDVDLGAIADASVSDTLTASIFKGTGTTTNAIDLATAEVAGLLPVSNAGNGAAPSADDQVNVSSSSSAATWKTLPDSDGSTQKLQYDTATNSFSASTDDDVPESGDFGNATDLTSAGAVNTNAVALGTDTTNNYVATIADSGSGDVIVSGSGSESAAVTLGLSSDVTRDSELNAYTIGTSAPTDGSTACTEGDMYLDHSANKVYWCVDSATDDWFGVALTDTP